MTEWTLFEWLVLVLAGAAVIIALLNWRMPRHPRDDTYRQLPRYKLYPGKEFPTVHVSNGIPTLQQLTEDMQLDSERLGIAERLYESGLAQFNHYVNNRDSVIERSRQLMSDLANSLSQPELALAESIGVCMTMEGADDEKTAVQEQYDNLSPQAQIYAQHKRREVDALRRIARDLEKDVPRTDYTALKARIASGAVTLDSVVSELPNPWQEIRSLNNRAERARVTRKPPRRTFFHVEFVTAMGLSEDRHAEKDGDWIISRKHGLMSPFQEPVPIYELREENKPPVRKGEVIVISQDPSSEWDTEFWRRGGRLDQVYLRAKYGESPEQLRRAYRGQIIRRLGWALAGSLTLANVALVAAKYL